MGRSHYQVRRDCLLNSVKFQVASRVLTPKQGQDWSEILRKCRSVQDLEEVRVAMQTWKDVPDNPGSRWRFLRSADL